MTSRDFCYWLMGHFEISKNGALNKQQTDMIKRHLALVFKHEIDPSLGGNKEELQEIHDGKPPKKHKTEGVFSPSNMLIRC